MEKDPKCINISCEFHDETAWENCAGEREGEPAIASCLRSQNTVPPDTITSLHDEVERLKVDCECHRIQAVDRGNSYRLAVADYDSAIRERDETANHFAQSQEVIASLRHELANAVEEIAEYKATVACHKVTIGDWIK